MPGLESADGLWLEQVLCRARGTRVGGVLSYTMRFDQSQHMRLSQQMKLAPHMIQSMEILQMPLGQLEERIEQELESNATLELAEGDGLAAIAPDVGATPTDPSGGAVGTNSEEFERLEDFGQNNPEAAENEYEDRPDPPDRQREREYEDRRPSGDGEVDAKSEAMANTASRPVSPSEQLREQWLLTEVDPKLRPLGELIIGYIEDDGYLRTPLATIIEKSPPGSGLDGGTPTTEQMERALKAVQLLLEPPGIGARDMRECLLLQIDSKEAEADDNMAWALVRKIVEDHLDDLTQNRRPKIAQKTGATMDELNAALDRLKTLRLAPGRELIQTAEAAIVPDVIVEYDAERDRYFAYLNDRRLPNLRLNQEYAMMAKDRAVPKPTREFIKTNLGNAQFLLEAIEQRKRTVLRVAEAVVAAQREFFDYGPQSIKPLPMTKVAEQLGIHVATVSRAVAEKYLQTPRGIVPLRKFFTGGTVNEEGEEVSWDAIKAALQDVLNHEDKRNPLSDDQLADELKKRGLEIARRTVAKYRGQLGIPTGRLRKAY